MKRERPRNQRAMFALLFALISAGILLTLSKATPPVYTDFRDLTNVFVTFDQADHFTAPLCTRTVGCMFGFTNLIGPYSSEDGDMGGYDGARALCTSLSGQPAHLCTREEVMYNAVWYGFRPELRIQKAWFSGGTYTQDPGVVLVNDCEGWTSSQNTVRGTVWVKPDGFPGSPSTAACNEPLPVLCCRD